MNKAAHTSAYSGNEMHIFNQLKTLGPPLPPTPASPGVPVTSSSPSGRSSLSGSPHSTAIASSHPNIHAALHKIDALAQMANSALSSLVNPPNPTTTTANINAAASSAATLSSSSGSSNLSQVQQNLLNISQQQQQQQLQQHFRTAFAQKQQLQAQPQMYAGVPIQSALLERVLVTDVNARRSSSPQKDPVCANPTRSASLQSDSQYLTALVVQQQQQQQQSPNSIIGPSMVPSRRMTSKQYIKQALIIVLLNSDKVGFI